MKKVSTRAWFALILAFALLAGTVFICVSYFVKGGQWATFPGSPHVYSGINLDGGVVTDRTGMRLMDATETRIYADDPAVRKATLHLLGDRYGYISAPLLSEYADEMVGFDVVNGLYKAQETPMAAHLTISAAVQECALRALGNYHGTVGVYNYKTGEILCAATSPSYDPDNMPDIENDTTGQYNGVYVNRFFDMTYTPGSIFKIVTTAAALAEIEDIEERTFTCEGESVIGGQKIVCNGVHGEVHLKEAFAHSCNVAFGEIAEELGAKTLQKYAEKLGLTEHFDCDGYLSSAGEIDLRDADRGDVAWAGIGQYTDQVNAYSFLRLMGAIGGGGEAAEPYLMARVGNDERTVYQGTATKTGRVLPSELCSELQQMMRNNVSSIYGDWQFGGLNVCAKSGTAEHEGRTADAMFAGFSQDEQYPLAFVVFVEGGGSGSKVAAPIAAQVLASCVNVIKSEN